MEVVLQEDYPALGYVGDTVSVKNGYARNYLIPRGIVVEAGSRNASELKHRLSVIMAKKNRLQKVAEERVQELEAINLEVSEDGKSFGSINSKQIETALKELDVDIKRQQIKLGEPLKNPGEHKIEIKLHSEVSAFILVNVIPQVVKKKKTPEEKALKGRGRRRTPRAEKVEQDEAGVVEGQADEATEVAAAEETIVLEDEVQMEATSEPQAATQEDSGAEEKSD